MKKTIGIVPHNGYRSNDKQSILTTKYLNWLSFKQNRKIQQSHTGKEAKIGPYKVDGLCDKDVFEVYGCL